MRISSICLLLIILTALSRANADAPAPASQAVKIGGVVLDAEGKTVANAKVVISALPKNENPALPIEQAVFTNSDGRWQYDQFVDQTQFVRIGAGHLHRGGNASTQIILRELSDDQIKQLRARDYTIKLPPVRLIKGTVTDFNEQPVSGATINVGLHRLGDSPATLGNPATDASGEFQFGGVPDAKYTFCIFAPGCAPRMIEFVNNATAAPVVIEMKEARTITGRIVGPDNRLPRRSFLYIASWRGSSILYRKVDFKDETGLFVIPDMPGDEISVWAGAYGEGWLRTIKAGEPVIMKFGVPPKLDGTVIDKETRQPLNNYRVYEGFETKPGGPIEWMRSMGGNYCTFEPTPSTEARATKDAGKNTFKVKIVDGSRPWVVRVVVDGYAPLSTRLYPPEEKQVSFTFEMQRPQK